MNTLEHLIPDIPCPDTEARSQARERWDSLVKPRGSLGRLEDLAVQIAGITGELDPSLERKTIALFAGDHGVVEQGVSKYPKSVTASMIRTFVANGAGINILAEQAQTEVRVINMGVDTEDVPAEILDRSIRKGTDNFMIGPAMTRQEAFRSLETGYKFAEILYAQGINLLGVGDMGIGNTTASSAITACLTESSVGQVTDKGTGLSAEQISHKSQVIEQALRVNRPDPQDPLDVLSKVGGFEIGAIAGCLIGGAAHRIPLLLDGFITSAGALTAAALVPEIRPFLIAAHISGEKGHRVALNHLGLTPLLDLEMRLGEGSGAALAMPVVETSVRLLNDMATFKEAGISGGE